ncbi:MAG: adenosylcobinamide-phosphate synthase CbiB [Candidatus Omnitrophica bacterium]|nr:adenosylcobinamide-phosphate synthase CbiB [Candidatus Omnitrophota bacterium]MCM8826445.1 adenosylcobinamide-phosphate synthase CbiB [Candidatus Omnitrophota bacterium]
MELILISYIADFIFGDPQWFVHPVRLIGKFISFLERIFNSYKNKILKRIYGIFTVFLVVSITFLCADLIIKIATKLHPIIKTLVWIFLAYTTLAIRDLAKHAKAVKKMLVINNIEEARKKLSLIVGRDTEHFGKEEIIRVTVEAIAESTTDGIVSPLFYLFLGGPVLALCFKAISTLDSMIGHKDERYLHFGWFAAKLDTVANFIPARITGLLIPMSALLCGKDFEESFRIMLRDKRKQDSINSAVSESAMAGALGIRLGGVYSYFGRVIVHPYIGSERRPISISLIDEAITLSIVTSFLMLLVGVLFKKIFNYFFCL